MMLLLSLISSCIFTDAPECPLQADGYAINLTLSAGTLASRAGQEEPGTEDECYIDVAQRDYAVFIFGHEAGDASDDFTFQQRFEPGTVTLEKMGFDTADPKEYTYRLSGVFKPLGKLDQLQLVVLANWHTDFGGDYIAFEKAIASKKLAELSPSKLELEQSSGEDPAFFKMPVTVADAKATTWNPSQTGRTGIPMVGVSGKIGVPDGKGDITINYEESIPMLRALAKIEIADLTPDGAKIEKCVLTGYNTKGSFIPEAESFNPKTDWSAGTPRTPVVSPTLPGGANSLAGKELHFVNIPREVTLEGKAQTRDCYVVYVPEMDLNISSRPVLQVYVKGNANPYTIQLADYDEKGKPKQPGYTTLLRNHIYRYNILSVGVEADLQLKIETPKWDPAGDEYYYEDTKAEYDPEGRFTWEWTPGNYDPDELVADGEEAKRRNVVVSKEGGIEAIATFTLKEPARGSWTLSLSPDDGTPNHWFRIDLWDWEKEEWIVEDQIEDADNLIAASLTGKIAPKEAKKRRQVKIRIVAQNLQTSGAPYTARLLMNVTTFDGRMTEVDLTSADPNTAGADHYIIKQNPTSEL